MICRDAKRWLLSAEVPKAPPADVRAHLRDCRKCRRLRRRLLRLELLVAAQPAPAPPPQRRAAIFARIDAAAPATLPLTPPPARRIGRLGLVLRAAAVLLLTTLALWGISRTQTSDDDPGPVAQQPPADNDVLARVLERHLELAEGLEPAERLQALAGMAADLRGESLRQARGPVTEDLAQLAQLHGKLLAEGVVPRASRLPAAERREVIAPLVDELRRAEADAESAARTAPQAAESLRGVARAAREARARLDSLLTGGTSS